MTPKLMGVLGLVVNDTVASQEGLSLLPPSEVIGLLHRSSKFIVVLLTFLYITTSK